MLRRRLVGSVVLPPGQSLAAFRILSHRLEWLGDGKLSPWCLLSDRADIMYLRDFLERMDVENGCSLADADRIYLCREASAWLRRFEREPCYSPARRIMLKELGATAEDESMYNALRSLVESCSNRKLKRPGAMRF